MPRTDLDLEAVSDFDARQDVRDAKRRATAEAAGATFCVCSVCGEKKNLNWLNAECEEVDASGQMCAGVYRAVLPVIVAVSA